MLRFNCTVCAKTFTDRSHRNRHVREVHNKVCNHPCSICGRPYKRRNDMEEHLLSHSGVIQQHIQDQPPVKKARFDYAFVEKSPSRYRNVKCYTLQMMGTATDLWTIYKRVKVPLKDLLSTSLQQLELIKFDFIIKILFEKITDTDETISCYFHSKAKMVSSTNQLSRQILEAFKGINKQVEDYLEKGSGWVIQSIIEFDVHLSKYRPFRGSTYIPLPQKLKNKKAVINVKNQDNRCFMWSVLSALHPIDRNPYRLHHYKQYINELNFDGIEFPVTISSVPQFERQNNLSINIYGYSDDEDRIRILHLSQQNEILKNISLLLYNQQHYCWIKDPERLLNAHNACTDRQFQCHRCLCLFYTAHKRDQHVERCKNPDLEVVEMPEEKILKFTNYHKMHRQPIIIYADFECLLEKVSTCLPSPSTSHTTIYQRHTPCGFGLAEVFGCCADKAKLRETHIFRGEGPVQLFLQQVISWGKRYQEQYSNQVSVNMTPNDWCEFSKTTVCHICTDSLDNDKVIDHCHFCGTYRGAAHSQCNIQYRLSRDVVVVLHNLRRYDGHLLLQRLGQVLSERKDANIFVIPKGFDDYLSFSLRLRHNKASWNLKFIDSYQFMSTSLARLVDNLRDKGLDKFTNMASHFTQEQLSFLLRKGVYPYDYMDSWSRFQETQLPTLPQFKSSLTDEDINSEDYQHAQEVWKIFNIQNMGEYHDLYLMTDVLLLADIFENFRSFCLNNYKLDPAHYFTSPSFSWDACLKHTGAQLELLTDPDMYTFLESGIRGGISTITNRYWKANNPLVGDYNPNAPSSYIIYLDANNLYGWTMACSLPIKDFQWLEDTSSIEVSEIPDDDDNGYILEVDLQYPDHLHHAHNDYPLAAERLEITDDMLSPYCSELKFHLAVSNAKTVKLVPNLRAKKNYIVHYRNLKLYLDLGLKVTKVHRVLTFKQQPWMAPYIKFNTEMRKLATSSFEKDLFKLFNNSVFGKTMENVRRYIDIKLVSHEDKVVKLASKLEYSGFKVLGDSLWAVKMKRATVKLNKPIYVGFTVLDLSKLLMYDFHYNYIVRKYNDRAKLLFTDTDSLCYHITTDDVYKDMHNDCHMFDFSDYPKDHFCHSDINKKVMGKFKDELSSTPVVEFVGLRAKMYSLLDVKGKEKKRAKGVKKSVVARNVRHAMYKKVLFSNTQLKHVMRFIRSEASAIATVVQNKTSLSAYDDKRYILANAFDTNAYGHCDIMDCSE